MTTSGFRVGDEVHIARIDFTGKVERVGPTRDPVIVLVAEGGAELVMAASALAMVDGSRRRGA